VGFFVFAVTVIAALIPDFRTAEEAAPVAVTAAAPAPAAAAEEARQDEVPGAPAPVPA
jgi:hypothetical protein